MEPIAPWSALLGGAMIGLGATLFWATHGRVLGVSGLHADALLPRASDRAVSLAVLLGLVAAGAAARAAGLPAFESVAAVSLPVAAAAGLLVGFGTRLGGGCTSGHGVCGVSRLAARSIAATLTFVAAGMVTVFVARHLIGAAP
jgi:uncharacterized protein